MPADAVGHADGLVGIVDRHVDVGAEDDELAQDEAELLRQALVALALDDLLLLPPGERMRSGGADQQVPVLGDGDHGRAQLTQLVARGADRGVDSGRDLEDALQELRLHLIGVAIGNVAQDPLDLLSQGKAVRIEDHELLFDPDGERGAFECVVEHGGDLGVSRPIIRSMEIKSATEQKSLLATLSPGKRTRLRRLLFEFGPGKGTLLLLPIDQGIEHGPRDFFPNPASKDPEYQFRLAAEAGYSAIACQIGLAEKYYPDYAGQVPLLLKINAKT